MGPPGRRDIAIVAMAWLLLTLLGEWLVASTRLYPSGASAEAEIVDGAFDLLVVLAIPVLVFVLVLLVFVVVRFRARDDSDGRPVRFDRRFVWPFVLVTAGLTVFVTVNPGLTGLAELAKGDHDPDLTIDVTAEQWNWTFEYPEYGVRLEKADELVLPEGEKILLRVTSTDVIHSLWIPAFRVKADAVPGRVHDVYLTPTEAGGFESDSAFRVQCAELCGTGHARMRAAVRVVDPAEFQSWIKAGRSGGG